MFTFEQQQFEPPDFFSAIFFTAGALFFAAGFLAIGFLTGDFFGSQDLRLGPQHDIFPVFKQIIYFYINWMKKIIKEWID